MAVAYVGLGANVGDPVRQLGDGVAALGRFPEANVIACSSLYRSAPIGVAAQPDFVNAVCAIETTSTADELMHRLLDIEREHGRARGKETGEPRTLDLDLLLYGSQILDTPTLTLPHPRMHERAFVLIPLAEIAPMLEIPGRGTVQVLLHACAGQRVEKLEGVKIAPA